MTRQDDCCRQDDKSGQLLEGRVTHQDVGGRMISQDNCWRQDDK